MTQKEVLSARLDEKTSEQLDEFADENSLSRSEAAERLIHQSLRVENGDVEIVPVSPDGGEIEEIQRSVRSIEEEIESSVQSIEDQGRYTIPLIAIGLLWVGIQISADVPVVLTVLSGLIVAFGLTYAYYIEYLIEVRNK
jgi:hypothetical protein